MKTLRSLKIAFCHHDGGFSGPAINGRVMALPFSNLSAKDFNFIAPEVCKLRGKGKKRRVASEKADFSAAPLAPKANPAFLAKLRQLRPGVFKKEWLLPA